MYAISCKLYPPLRVKYRRHFTGAFIDAIDDDSKSDLTVSTEEICNAAATWLQEKVRKELGDFAFRLSGEARSSSNWDGNTLVEGFIRGYLSQDVLRYASKIMPQSTREMANKLLHAA
jgi:hypothetical protein